MKAPSDGPDAIYQLHLLELKYIQSELQFNQRYLPIAPFGIEISLSTCFTEMSLSTNCTFWNWNSTTLSASTSILLPTNCTFWNWNYIDECERVYLLPLPIAPFGIEIQQKAKQKKRIRGLPIAPFGIEIRVVALVKICTATTNCTIWNWIKLQNLLNCPLRVLINKTYFLLNLGYDMLQTLNQTLETSIYGSVH